MAAKAKEIFKKGGYNICVFETDCATGVTTIRMYGFSWKKPLQFKVKNLGLPAESGLAAGSEPARVRLNT